MSTSPNFASLTLNKDQLGVPVCWALGRGHMQGELPAGIFSVRYQAIGPGWSTGSVVRHSLLKPCPKSLRVWNLFTANNTRGEIAAFTPITELYHTIKNNIHLVLLQDRIIHLFTCGENKFGLISFRGHVCVCVPGGDFHE